MKITVFSGTTEGRKLSEMLSAANVAHNVCVATDYGCDVMQSALNATVHIGRMDSSEMTAFLEKMGYLKEDLVVDATHPYATEVSDNIKTAVDVIGCRLIRVARKSACNEDDVTVHADMADFAGYIDTADGNILLTTGTNTLKEYCEIVSAATLDRTFVRVLPSSESIDICKKNNIASAHIIAMQGPFSYEMNCALLRQYDIKHMLTKDSGAAGGYDEKIRAAKDNEVACHILKRPGEDLGLSAAEAFEAATGMRYKLKRKIYLIGTGMGNADTMTAGARYAIADADAVFGAKRLLNLVAAKHKYEMYMAEDIIDVLKVNDAIITAAVLYSGDTGFYSGGKGAYEKFRAWDEDADIEMIPGISSVSYLAAKLCVSYDDAKIVSIHGRNTPADMDILLDAVRHSQKTFVLLSGEGDVRSVAKLCKNAGIKAEFCVGRNLSYADEEIRCLSADEAQEYTGAGVVTALILNRAAASVPVINMLTDNDFIREDIPMTKQCIRNESIIRLRLREGDTVFDIGGGTGSVGIAIAALSPTLNVTVIEKKPEAVSLIKRNCEKTGVGNVNVIEGDATSVIPGLPCPDRVFIGGSGGKLREIISQITYKGAGIRYVVNAVSLETMEEVRHVISDMNAKDVEMVQLSVSDIKAVGSHHMMNAGNPVTIFSFEI